MDGKPDQQPVNRANASVLGSATVAGFDLPPADTKRWIARRKAVVVAAVRGGALGIEEACRRYKLSMEEFLTWQRAIDRHGIPGLRVTRVQIYRNPPAMRSRK